MLQERILNLLNIFFDELKVAGVDFDNFDESSLEKIKEMANGKRCNIWINDYPNLRPVFINDTALNYHGLDPRKLNNLEFGFYASIMDPADFNGLEEVVTFFDHFSKDVFRKPYRVLRGDGEWRWVYALVRALNHDRIGRAIYVLSAAWDIEDILHPHLETDLIADSDSHLELERILYNSLTKREKEILNLIARDMTSQEIADQLFIEPSTVDTHRKHIIKKLQAKSSLGLVRYALLFPES